MKRVNKRQTLIDFFNKYHRAPSNSEKKEKEERALSSLLKYYVKKGDKEIIALKEKYKDNTKKHASQRKSKSVRKALLAASNAKRNAWPERIFKLRKQFEETGLWPGPETTDYKWICNNRSKSEEVLKLWEDMHKDKPEGKKKVQKQIEKTPAVGIEAKKVSELTMSEISELLKLIGNKRVKDLLKDNSKKEEEKIEISKIKTTLPEEVLRIVINPQENKTTITNPNWEIAKTMLENMIDSKVINNHFAAKYLFDSKEFAREVALYVKENPRKQYLRRLNKICESLYNNLPADIRFFENPANIRDLVSKCL